MDRCSCSHWWDIVARTQMHLQVRKSCLHTNQRDMVITAECTKLSRGFRSDYEASAPLAPLVAAKISVIPFNDLPGTYSFLEKLQVPIDQVPIEYEYMVIQVHLKTY